MDELPKPLRRTSRNLVLTLVIVGVLVVGVLAFFLVRLIGLPFTQIGDILAAPDSYWGKAVTVRGQVQLLIYSGLDAYQITDKSGTILIVNTGAIPSEFGALTVTGTVRKEPEFFEEWTILKSNDSFAFVRDEWADVAGGTSRGVMPVILEAGADKP